MSVLWLVFLAQTVLASDSRLCDNVLFKDKKFSLTSNEKILVCGSSKGSEGWKDVPLSQSEYHLKVFLQNAGYFAPTFERHERQLWVWLGPRTNVSELVVRNDHSGILDPSRVRQVEGRPLTSDSLDNVSKWADLKLKSNGYACPKIDVKAQAWDRKVVVTPTPGAKGTIRNIEWDGRDNLNPTVLSRYSASTKGDVYDVRDSQLTTNRLFADGLFEMALTQPSCHGDQVDLKVRTSVGKPRLVKFGLGASTEELPFMDIGYKNARLDRSASSFTTLAHFSPRLQSLTASSELFMFPFLPSMFWGPRFKVARKSEHLFEEFSAKGGADIGRYWDQFQSRWLIRGGPTWNYVDTVEGIGPRQSQFLNWEGSLSGSNHNYELNVRDQFEGWTGRFDYRGQRSDLGLSKLNVDRFEASFKYLWNINSFTPPLFVLASRFDAVAVNANPVDLSSSRERLPLEYRIFWGGDQNLRGFSRQSLNNKGLGYLTGIYAGFELRLIEELPWRLQPFLLWDIARLGARRFTADAPIFTSKGFGLRWASPIGTLRGSAARGSIENGDTSTKGYAEEWVYFFSFGQEF